MTGFNSIMKGIDVKHDQISIWIVVQLSRILLSLMQERQIMV